MARPSLRTALAQYLLSPPAAETHAGRIAARDDLVRIVRGNIYPTAARPRRNSGPRTEAPRRPAAAAITMQSLGGDHYDGLRERSGKAKAVVSLELWWDDLLPLEDVDLASAALELLLHRYRGPFTDEFACEIATQTSLPYDRALGPAAGRETWNHRRTHTFTIGHAVDTIPASVQMKN